KGRVSARRIGSPASTMSAMPPPASAAARTARIWAAMIASAVVTVLRSSVRSGDDEFGVFEQRCVDHLALVGEGALLGPGEVEHGPGPAQLFVTGTEGIADDGHTVGVDGDLAGEAGLHGVLGLGGQSVEVRDVGPDRVEGVSVVGAGGQQRRTAHVLGDVAVVSVGRARGSAAEIGDEVLGAPHEAVSVRAGG